MLSKDRKSYTAYLFFENMFMQDKTISRMLQYEKLQSLVQRREKFMIADTEQYRSTYTHQKGHLVPKTNFMVLYPALT